MKGKKSADTMRKIGISDFPTKPVNLYNLDGGGYWKELLQCIRASEKAYLESIKNVRKEVGKKCKQKNDSQKKVSLQTMHVL